MYVLHYPDTNYLDSYRMIKLDCLARYTQQQHPELSLYPHKPGLQMTTYIDKLHDLYISVIEVI